MCGLAVFAARRLQSSPLKQPEQQVAAFLNYLGVPPLPGQQQLLAGAALAAVAGTAGATAPGQQQARFKSECTMD